MYWKAKTGCQDLEKQREIREDWDAKKKKEKKLKRYEYVETKIGQGVSSYGLLWKEGKEEGELIKNAKGS